MRKSLPLFAFASLSAFGFNANAQEENPVHSCGAERIEREIENNPSLKQARVQFENWMEKEISKKRKAPQACNSSYVIPLVVHVYGKTQHGDPVNDAVVKEMVKRVNDDYNGTNDDYNTVRANFQARRKTLNITFALTTKDVNGNAIPVTADNPDGLSIIYHGVKSGFGNGNAGAQVAVDAWDNYKFMNVYIQASIYGGGDATSSGVAWYPDVNMSNSNSARVVYNGRYVSSNTSKEFSSVMTHEFGHWLDLRHTFQGGCSAPGDLVDDTPADNTNSSNCTANTSCSEEENNENYMDYSQCYKMFTKGQVERMVAALNHDARKTLWSNSNLTLLGLDHLISAGTDAPVATIDASATEVYANSLVTFEDKSCNAPTSRTWTFDSATPASATTATATASWDTPGTYTVTLVSTNGNGSSDPVTVQIKVIAAPNCLLFESFEGGNLPSGWTQQVSGGLNFTFPGTVAISAGASFSSKPKDGTKALYQAENWVGSGPGSQTITTGEIDLTSAMNPVLNYSSQRAWDATWPIAKPVHSIDVSVSESASGPFTNVDTDDVSTTQFTDWVDQSIDLTAYKGKKIYIRWTTDSHHYYWRMDNLCLDGGVGVKENSFKDFSAVVIGGELTVKNADRFELFDAFGRQITSVANGNTFNVSTLASGIYIVKAHKGQIFGTKKVMIQK